MANDTGYTLKPLQKRFCLHYLKTLNASEAARQAGYSAKTAEQIGCRLLRNVKVREYLSERLNESLGSERTIIKATVLEHLKAVAFGTDSTAYKLKALEMLMRYVGLSEPSPVSLNIHYPAEFRE